MSARTSVVALSIAGLVGSIWFTTLVIVQGILQPDYSHIAMPISALAAWPAGWMQRINFYVLGFLMAAFTIGVHRSIRPTSYGVVGIALGAAQRVLAFIWFACIITIAVRSLRIARPMTR